jgi:hypothetical protein
MSVIGRLLVIAIFSTGALPREGPESVPRERHSHVAGETIFAPARNRRETKQPLCCGP